MFIIRTNFLFYTGRAGEGWVSESKAEAFTYSTRAEAERKAASFNRFSMVHGLTFAVEAA